MAQLAIQNLSKLVPFPGGPWNLQHKFHLYLILYIISRGGYSIEAMQK